MFYIAKEENESVKCDKKVKIQDLSSNLFDTL